MPFVNLLPYDISLISCQTCISSIQSLYMRIIAGEKKGHLLYTPKGLLVRPTADRVKESLFSILGDPPENARVLDLFAGTGALGLESLSRGAKEAVFVESHPAAIQVLEKNIVKLQYQNQARIIRQFVLKALSKSMGTFDWIFIDPPYSEGQLHKVLDFLGSPLCSLLKNDTIVITEFSTTKSLQPDRPLMRHGRLTLKDERIYGQTGLTFYQIVTEAPL